VCVYIQKNSSSFTTRKCTLLLQKNKQMKMSLLTKGEEARGRQIVHVLMLLTLEALILGPKGFS